MLFLVLFIKIFSLLVFIKKVYPGVHCILCLVLIGNDVDIVHRNCSSVGVIVIVHIGELSSSEYEIEDEILYHRISSRLLMVQESYA